MLGQTIQKVHTISFEGKGQRTTTSRELIALPSGAVVIDTPGMRELQLWDAAEGLNQTFQDIDDLAKSCRYRNCRHESEDGCAVKAAITEGDLDTARLRNYKKLQREQEFWERKADPAKLSNSKKRWKHIQKNMRQKRKFEDRD